MSARKPFVAAISGIKNSGKTTFLEHLVPVLRARGLRMVYMGLESGCDAVLTRMNKGHDAAAIVAAGQKARRCGLALSVTAISGLGSRELLREHGGEGPKELAARLVTEARGRGSDDDRTAIVMRVEKTQF